MVLDAHEPRNPRILLETDHAQIEALLARALVHVRSGDGARTARAWRRFEEALLAHFGVEEMFLLPLLAERDPVEARKLEGEHAALRRSLGELGLAAELHALRVDQVEAFAEALRAHVVREDSMLHPYVERQAPVSIARAMLDRLQGAAAWLARAAKRTSHAAHGEHPTPPPDASRPR